MCCLWWTVWLRDAVRKSNPQKWPLLANESSVAQRLEQHGGSWVWIPSGAQIFSVSSYGWFFTSPFISFMKSIKQWFCVFLHLFRSFLASISLLSYFVFGWPKVLSPKFSWVHSSHAITAKVYCSQLSNIR